MVYNYFRSYDPSIGRYTTNDPIGLNGGLNRYAYVAGDPAGKVDPLGLFEVIRHSTGSFSGDAAYYKSAGGIQRRSRERSLQRMGNRLQQAIDSEPDCECKELLQRLYDNWKVRPTMTSNPIAEAETDLVKNESGNVTGGFTDFYENTWTQGNTQGTFVHEFGHITPSVEGTRGRPGLGGLGLDPREKAANQMELMLLNGLLNGGSLCPLR